ncbi:transferase family-domain-containing protein [Xylogone sp. PMI_703]|nr:transferase family-domain-containing protein [Xylogone sp. PMI_703]
MSETSPTSSVIVSARIFPKTRQYNSTTVPLSIIDATVVNFARCAAVWFYDAPLSKQSGSPTIAHYQTSLQKTLNSYPQWCGRLHWSLSSPTGPQDHTERYRRVHLTYNTKEDPGVLFIAAASSRKLSDFIPTLSTRKTTLKAWDASQIPTAELLPSTPLALSRGSDHNSPGLIIQITTFSCGGTAVAIELAHALADAQALCQFAKDWSLTSRFLLQNPSSLTGPRLSPVFNPQLLDTCAAGDIDAQDPDSKLQEQARRLPVHRYDWFKTVPNQPFPAPIPEDFDASNSALSPSDPIPWNDWDVNAPVSHRVFHFSKDELNAMYEHAGGWGSRISKHDALLAHVWGRILHARQLLPGTEVFLDLTFGLRSRLDPPLPESFLGSPIMLTAIPHITSSSYSSKNPVHGGADEEIANLASKIRTTLEVFNSSAISAHLHDAAFEACPQRLWQACLGRKHILLTSWIYTGAYDVIFTPEDPEVNGRALRYVEPLMPCMDGLVEIMEAGTSTQGNQGKRHWTADGVDVSVYLEDGAMKKLLSDELLWPR